MTHVHVNQYCGMQQHSVKIFFLRLATLYMSYCTPLHHVHEVVAHTRQQAWQPVRLTAARCLCAASKTVGMSLHSYSHCRKTSWRMRWQLRELQPADIRASRLLSTDRHWLGCLAQAVLLCIRSLPQQARLHAIFPVLHMHKLFAHCAAAAMAAAARLIESDQVLHSA